MAYINHILAFTASTAVACALATIPLDSSLPCMTSPVSNVAAGDNIDFQLLQGNSTSCEMLITFADPEYLPISLTASLENCTGLLSAGFQLPESVGDGLALIQWQCAGELASSCNVVNISGGCGDTEAFEAQRAELAMNVTCPVPEVEDGVNGKRDERPGVHLTDLLKIAELPKLA